MEEAVEPVDTGVPGLVEDELVPLVMAEVGESGEEDEEEKIDEEGEEEAVELEAPLEAVDEVGRD